MKINPTKFELHPHKPNIISYINAVPFVGGVQDIRMQTKLNVLRKHILVYLKGRHILAVCDFINEPVYNRMKVIIVSKNDKLVIEHHY